MSILLVCLLSKVLFSCPLFYSLHILQRREFVCDNGLLCKWSFVNLLQSEGGTEVDTEREREKETDSEKEREKKRERERERERTIRTNPIKSCYIVSNPLIISRQKIHHLRRPPHPLLEFQSV